MFCRIIKAGCWLLLMGAISSIAVARGIPPRPNPESFLSCHAGPSYNENMCDKAKHGFERHFTGVSDACKDADSWEVKKVYLIRLLELYHSAEYKLLEDERMISYEEMCGAFLWEVNTRVQLYTDDVVPPDYDDLTLKLEVDDEVEVHARILTHICDERDWDACGPEVELPYSGQWAWGSTDTDVFELESELARSGRVKAAGGGQALLVAQMPDFEDDPYLLQALADVTVGTQEGVDIALVIQSDMMSYFEFIGMEWWDCDEYACVGWGADTWWEREGWWGLCGSPGDELLGRFQVEDPSVLKVSLNEDGPFLSGPLTIAFTCDDNNVALTDRLWFKALNEGATRIGYCIGVDDCNPLLTPQHYGQWDKQITVGTAEIQPVDPPGLRQIGAQVAADLDANFEDYRFAATAFGAYPDGVVCSSNVWNWDEFRPYWDLAPYRDILDFTSSDSTIAAALSQVRLFCDERGPVYPFPIGRSIYSATIHTINDFAWRDDAFRTVIVLAVNPACALGPEGPPYCDTERVSGYTSQDVIDAALAANVRLIMLNAGWGSYAERIRGPFQDIALQTNGLYTEDYFDFVPMLTAFETAFQWVLDEEPRLGRQ